MYKPNYTISNKLLNKIAEIESLRTQIGSSYLLPEREIEIRYRASIEATHSSTSIEGNPLNLKQVEKTLSGTNHLTRQQYAEIEVRNYKKALDFIEQRKSNKSPINLSDVLQIHKITTNQLLPIKKVGRLRVSSIYIVDQNNNIIYTGPESKILTREIDELFKWLNTKNDTHPIIVAGILHFHFIAIHPLSDGNGRTARLLTNLYLGLMGYDFRSSLVLESYYSIDKLAYYEALNLADNYIGRKNADLNTWLDYFVDGFLSSAKILAIEVTALSGLAKDINKIKFTKIESNILNYVKQFGSISLSEAENILMGVSKRTIQRRLMKLVDNGYLVIHGNARNTRYFWRNS